MAHAHSAAHPNGNLMWDTKRQIIWLVGGISFGTYIIFTDAHDELGRFEPSVFIFWEIVLLGIVLALGGLLLLQSPDAK